MLKNYYLEGMRDQQKLKEEKVGKGYMLEPGTPMLLDQVRDTIRAKHYSMRTEETYLQ